MRWLNAAAARARRDADERGVVLVLVCTLVVTVMVMAAFVVDVGGLLQERRELQNGADAAALAVAHSCALNASSGDCASDASAATAASTYANANAGDGTSNVDAAHLDKAARTVTVSTSTRSKSGGSIVPAVFSRVIGAKGETVHARATATWGPPASGNPIPLALSICEFAAAGFDGPTTVIFHTDGKTAACKQGPAGQDVPGGFGWLDTTTGTACTAAITAGGSVSADTGNSVPKACGLSELLGQTLLVPIFDGITGTGTKASYHIVGFGAFVLTGYRFPGVSGGSPVPCKSPTTCVAGTFTHFVDPADVGSIGGSDFGVAVIKLVS